MIKDNPYTEWQPDWMNPDSLLNYPVIATGCNDGRKTRIWFASDDNIYYSDFDNIFNPPDTTSPKNSNLYYLNFYPNPVTTGFAKLQVYTGQDAIATLKILDYTGKVVLNTGHINLQHGNYNTLQINCDGLASGLYFFVFDTGTKVYIDKFVVFK